MLYRVIAVVAAFTIFSLGVSTGTAPASAYTEVMIEDNETLWDVAARKVGNDTDIRAYIYQIQKENHITDPASIIPGQVIRLPEIQ
ncbi:MAG: LysM peptidoglycan-binding domain-containing protein [Dialister sp.]|nr:LysM peptidoglycan-binding domain-containing protein [Dialister sp.]